MDKDDRRRMVDTHVLIQRDRALHRLGLHNVESLPHATLAKCMQDICALLDISDVDEAVSSIQALVKATLTIPALVEVNKEIAQFIQAVHTLQDNRTIHHRVEVKEIPVKLQQILVDIQVYFRAASLLLALHSYINTEDSINR